MVDDALVIGGGIAGLLAAQALAQQGRRVTLLERHAYPDTAAAPQARRGVPQSRCLHLLAGAGMVALDALLPGWRVDLVAAGATPFDASADTALWLTGGWLPRAPSGIAMLACSRALLEGLLRHRLAATAGVQVLQGRRVLGLAGTAGRVVGLHVAGALGPLVLPAGTVVDASGSHSALPAWLRALGLPPVPESRHGGEQHYLSRWYHLPPQHAPAWSCLSIAPSAATLGCSAMWLRAERDHWGLVLLAPNGVPLPADDAGVRAFARPLAGGELHALLGHAQPVSALHRLGTTPCRIRHFEALRRWPAGLLALGDGVCTLDPYFGLGMSNAARGALLLRGHAGPGFQQALATLNQPAWQLATAPDLPAWRQVCKAAPHSVAAAHRLLAVQQLLLPQSSLLEEETTA